MMIMLVMMKWPMQSQVQLHRGIHVALTMPLQDLMTTFLTKLGTSSSEEGE